MDFKSQGSDDDAAAGDEGVPVEPGGCPHIDRNDLRCGHRFSLGRIDQAFRVCLDAFHGCPIFHRINGEACGRASGPIDRASLSSGIIALTIHDNALPLRNTGT